ncbi:hypothetical protein H5410_040942 [Solanum commersonii]|uniref:Uncharacterized protein n=1 Tax=Solanum commersonii TaxID=4109 RepID=A0A9J5XT08_SOLCO|nr:hypothetical protein H5410_040942 [Solanum commersonii]
MDEICALYEKKIKELNPVIREISYDISYHYNFIDDLADMSALVSLDSNNELLVETFPFDVKDLSPRPLPFPIAPGATNEYLIVLFIIDPSSFSVFISNLQKETKVEKL